MVIKTKEYFAEQVQLKVNPGDIPADARVTKQEIFNVMDQKMNFLAGENFSENFIIHGIKDVDDHYLATFEAVAVTDLSTHSFSTIPGVYADLPYNQGIYEVSPTNDINARFIVVRSRDTRRRKNLMEGNMENMVFCYPENGKLIFNRNNIKVAYTTLTIRLVLTDAANIASGARYPVPPTKESMFIDLVADYFLHGTILPDDPLNDDVKLR